MRPQRAVAQVGRSLAQAIQQARLAKKMNQKELATVMNFVLGAISLSLLLSDFYQ